MQTKRFVICCFVALVALAEAVHAAPWKVCGELIKPSSCQISGQPLTKVEYGIAYNSAEPVPVICT